MWCFARQLITWPRQKAVKQRCTRRPVLSNPDLEAPGSAVPLSLTNCMHFWNFHSHFLPAHWLEMAGRVTQLQGHMCHVHERIQPTRRCGCSCLFSSWTNSPCGWRPVSLMLAGTTLYSLSSLTQETLAKQSADDSVVHRSCPGSGSSKQLSWIDCQMPDSER